MKRKGMKEPDDLPKVLMSLCDGFWRAWLLETWHSKRTLLVEVVKSLLDEQSWGVRKALAEVMMGPVCPVKLRAICEKGLLLLAITIPEMEKGFTQVLYHCLFMTTWLLVSKFFAVYPLAIHLKDDYPKEVYRHRSSRNSFTFSEVNTSNDIPNPEVLCYLGPLFPKNLSLFWQDEGTNMLSRFLHVQNPTAKQAVITAIDLLGRAVINASEMGVSFPLKRRDQMLDYVLTLMGRDESEDFVDSSIELLHTQSLALCSCTTLVSIEPRLPLETRNRVMKATLSFFALPRDPSDIVDPLISNLITLLCAILLTSGEDGRSRAEQLLHILRQVDLHVSSPMEHQRRRAAFVLPSRDSLSLGERIIAYLPRCTDTSSEVRKVAVQIVGLFFSISLSLPKLVVSSSDLDLEVSYSALSSLEDVISILRRDASIDQSEVFNRVLSSVCVLLTKDELVIALHTCTAAICDKIKQSADGAIQAVIEFITKRGNELNDVDVARTTQSLLSATVSVIDKHSRQEAFSQHVVLSVLFLEYVVSVLNRTPVLKSDIDKGDHATHPVELPSDEHVLQAAILALTALFRGGGKTGKKAVEQSYSSVLSALTLQLGSWHGLSGLGQQEHSRALLTAFQSFCDCVGDIEMGKIPDCHMPKYIAQVLGVIVALLEDADESVQLTAVQCLLTVLKSSPKDAVNPVLINLSVRLRNLQISMNAKMRSNAFAAYGALSIYGIGSQHQAFLEQITLRQLAPLMEVDGFSALFSKQVFNSEHRSDYEDFIRDLTRQLCQLLASRVDKYLASAIQAFDAPWPVIQANAIYFSSCMLSLSDDQRTLAPYFSQVFALLVGKMSRSPDAVVRATCSFALGMLLKASNPLTWMVSELDRVDSSRSSQD
ncbi:putative protein SHOOT GRAVITROPISM 6 [Cocos nucifera]|nr:putative protein SHOOT GRAVITROPISM 6 [Cocos nucifera]